MVIANLIFMPKSPVKKVNGSFKTSVDNLIIELGDQSHEEHGKYLDM
jgi:hypothetical protein